MRFTLYVRSHCQGCTRVLKALAPLGLKLQVVNLDEESTNSGVMIVPALFKDERLLAYGDDIAAYLNK